MKSDDYRLDIYETSQFAFDPKDKDFYIKLKKYPEFQLNSHPKDRHKYLVYIALMYDKHSDIRSNTEMTYWQKKKTSALAAGFKLTDGEFSKDVEYSLLSKDKEIISAILRYLKFQYTPEFTQLCMYQMLHDIILKEAIVNQKPSLLKEATSLTKIISELEETIYGGKELVNAKEALYETVGKFDLGIRAEDIARGLEEGKTFHEFGKFGDYEPDKLEFMNMGND